MLVMSFSILSRWGSDEDDEGCKALDVLPVSNTPSENSTASQNQMQTLYSSGESMVVRSISVQAQIEIM